MTGGKDGRAVVVFDDGAVVPLVCKIPPLAPGKYSNARQKELDKQVLVRAVARDEVRQNPPLCYHPSLNLNSTPT